MILRSIPMALLAVGTLALGASAQVPPAGVEQEIKTNQEKLETLRERAEEKRKAAREAARQERSVLERLGKADEALRATRDYLRRLELGQQTVEEQLKRTAVDLSWAEEELTTRRSELVRRMRYAYMVDKTRALEIVFSAESLASLLQRTAFLNRVLRQDRRLIEEVTARRVEVKETLARLQEQKAELDLLEGEKQKEERHYTSLQDERRRDLDTIRDQKAANEAAARELEQAATRMEQVLAELDRRRQEALRQKDPVFAELDLQDFGANRGRLPWPVQGQIVTPFGRQVHPKYKTVTVCNGLDIAAPEGTAVFAVGPGIVDLVQWLPGYGETVIVNHGRGYYSVYGHLASVSVRPDDRVDPGHLIGTVGDTGSLKGVCLHFEIRQGGGAQDPQLWLR
jgi:septal ring factor EnvC (AmiA/AmiB activator)